MSGSSSRVAGSLLDRLMDQGDADRGLSLRDLHASVRRDLEALLNARRPWASVPDRFATLRNSILGYGLPDFSAGAFNAAAQRETLCREIAATIKRFEPRLTHVSVKLRDRSDSMEPLLRIRIDALLHVEEADEPIGFDTLLDATTTDLIVRPDTNV
ncbi:MAG TPA: type VI secretion system baseplate subunit TssE [Rhodopila sp.]|jgi:type VI secretion system protein ImpF|nr:type VI secretion system baseplate subunit TssE [Rhodopila sp.]